MSKAKQLTEQLNSILEESNEREWEHNGHTFKETIVDSKEVEAIPGLVLKFNKIQHEKDGQVNRTSWELDRSVNVTDANNYISKIILDALGAADGKVGGWSGAIPMSITLKGENSWT